MEVIINGSEVIDIPEKSVIADVFTHLNIELQTPGIAISVNNRVISKARWQVYVLQSEDKVEVIRAFQGG
jgi:thiamine biosynthesis protein ThiS